jgi:hypothetical protein
VEENMTPLDVILNGLNIRGREYVDCDEYLDEVQQYRLDALKEGREEKEDEEDGRKGID